MPEHFVELAKSNAYSDVTKRLDPEKVFQARARSLLAASSPGIERFAYNLLGPNLLGSLAFALDPYARFEVGTAIITPVNRTRRFQCVWPATRSIKNYDTGTSCIGRDGCVGLFSPNQYTCTALPPNASTTNLSPQLGYLGFISDTTKRTRPINSQFGEYEIFIPTIHSSSRSAISYRRDGYDVLACPFEHYRLYKQSHSDVIGPSAIMSPASLDAVLAAERADSSTYINKYKLDLVEQALPEHRQFQLSYNVAELKDLPLMLRSTVKFVKDSPKLLLDPKGAVNKISNQFLNEKFGWESTFNAVKDMLSLPTKLSKRINYLLERQGKPTSFRSRKRFTDRISSPPTFSYSSTPRGFMGSTVGVTSSRDIELRCVVNAVINLPRIDVPTLRQDLLEKLRGQDVTPTDLYNLVPWTWLYDWFSGLGEYISLMDALNRDPSLINFGFLTYVSKGTATTSFAEKGVNPYIYNTFTPNSSVTDDQVVWWRHTSVCNWKYSIRKDVGKLSGVKSVSNLPSLSAIQQAIVGALLLKRSPL